MSTPEHVDSMLPAYWQHSLFQCEPELILFKAELYTASVEEITVSVKVAVENFRAFAVFKVLLKEKGVGELDDSF